MRLHGQEDGKELLEAFPAVLDAGTVLLVVFTEILINTGGVPVVENIFINLQYDLSVCHVILLITVQPANCTYIA